MEIKTIWNGLDPCCGVRLAIFKKKFLNLPCKMDIKCRFCRMILE